MNYRSLAQAVMNARQTFSAIKKQFPMLDAKLMFSSRSGNAPVDDGAEGLLGGFPGMFVDDQVREKALEIFGEQSELRAKLDDTKSKMDIASTEKAKAKLVELQASLNDLAPSLTVDPALEFALQLGVLDYEEIQKLKQSPLIDQKRTPMSRASIRIVLGAVGGFEAPRGTS